MTQTQESAPKISVVTVVFNGAGAIAETIESTLSQDYQNTEYVVIDGASSDGTQAIVAGYGTAIDVFVSETDAGIYDAMNKGIALASGELLLFMNCGDVFASPDALSSAARAAVPGVRQAVFGSWMRNEAGGRRRLCHPRPESGFFNHQSILYSRSLHQKYGGYVSANGFTTADYLFFSTLINSGEVQCIRIDKTIALIDTRGVSQGPQTYSQKFAIDFLFGRASRLKLLLILAAHPTYRRCKSVLERFR